MKTEVQIRQSCKYCEGAGIRQNPIWAEFWEQPNACELTGEQVEAWFMERGAMQRSRPVMGKCIDILPDEAIWCWECEGQGQITRWVPIDELRRLLAPEETLLTLG